MTIAEQNASVEYIQGEASIWAALLATASKRFELTPSNELYTLDGINTDWDSVDCGHAVRNELAE